MDILELAEQNYVISFGVTLGIGLVQGMILARGIRKRFPGLRMHARATSTVLLILFSISAISNIVQFSSPQKISLDQLSVPETPEQAVQAIMGFLGLDAGFGSVVALFVSVILVLVFRLADLPGIARYFMFALSVVVVSVAVLGRFTDYVPTGFQVLMYTFYQGGITIGIFAVTRRRGRLDI